MYDVTAFTEYPFPNDISDREYRVFPDCMENDETIAFHGTSEQNFKAICEQGFRFAEVLQSLSFAKNSSGALGYACQKRNEASPNGCVIAVRFDDLSKPGIKVEHSIIHIYRLDSAPRVIGYCIIPDYYRHI